jgi:hypothetical protein
MALKPDNPGRSGPDALARLLLEAAENNRSLLRRSPRWARYGRSQGTGSMLFSSEHLAEMLPEFIVSQQPAGEMDEREVDNDNASVERSDDAALFSSEDYYLQLSRSQAWARTNPGRRWHGALAGRCALAAGVVAVILALMANMLNHPDLRSAGSAPVAEASDAPAAARSNGKPYEVALAAPTASIEEPQAPVATPPHAPIAMPDPAPRTEAPVSTATMPERTEPTDPKAERTQKPQHVADLPAEQQERQVQGNPLPDQAAEGGQHADRPPARIAQPETRLAARPRHAAGTSQPPVASAPVPKPMPEPPARSAVASPSVPQQLMLARAALVNRDRRAARGLMEEAQTLITFQPAHASPRLSVATASQVTEALVLLGRGDEAAALQCLDHVIEAIRPTS